MGVKSEEYDSKCRGGSDVFIAQVRKGYSRTKELIGLEQNLDYLFNLNWTKNRGL